MREKILSSLRLTNRCYLVDVLRRIEPERHEAIKAQFEQHMGAIADYCMEYFVSVDEMSTEFIRGLHKIHFPRDYRLDSTLPDGRKLYMVPGEYKKFENGLDSTAFPGAVMSAVLPEDVPQAMEKAVSRLNISMASAHEAKSKRDLVIHFALDFSAIHPFGDANGRIACILADLLMIKAGLEALGFSLIKELDRTALYHAAGLAQHSRDLTPLYEVIERYNYPHSGAGQEVARPRSIYDDLPSAFQTYIRRSDNKQYVVAQVFAKLAKQRLSRHFVVTDIGAGTGLVAEGILHGLSQHEGMTLEYHYLEPSLTSMSYFRAHSRHASLPEVIYHNIPLESYLLPSSDLILVVQAMQYLPSLGETLRNIVSALKPGGLALVVLPYPGGDEWQMLGSLVHMSAIYGDLKHFLDKERINHEEIVVESLVHISLADRNTPEGDDLLTFYFQSPPTMLAAAAIEDFWAGIAEFTRDGAVRKKEAFFWFTGTPCPTL